jgi:hypothetical protein
MMFIAEAPDLANAYCILQAVDILNMLHPQQIQQIHSLLLPDSRRTYYIITQLPLWSSYMHLVRFVPCIWMTIILTARVRMCVLLHVFTFVEHIIAIAKAISCGSTVRMERDGN